MAVIPRLDKATIEVDAIMTNPPEPRQFAVLDENGMCIAHLSFENVTRVIDQFAAMKAIHAEGPKKSKRRR